MANPNPNTSGLRPFQPGSKGGPGRPKKRPISEAYDSYLKTEVPEKVRVAMGLPKGAIWAEAIACAMAREAVKGNVVAAKEMREGTEGKAPIRIEGLVERKNEVVVTFEGPVPPKLEDRLIESARETQSNADAIDVAVVTEAAAEDHK